MKPIAITFVLLFPSSIFAAINGRCSGSYDNGLCICLDKDVCRNRWGGEPYQGRPGDWPCPNDPANVWGCTIMTRCPGKGLDTGCAWRNGCTGKILPGETILSGVLCVPVVGFEAELTFFPDPVCPGGKDFICCDFIEPFV